MALRIPGLDQGDLAGATGESDARAPVDRAGSVPCAGRDVGIAPQLSQSCHGAGSSAVSVAAQLRAGNATGEPSHGILPHAGGAAKRSGARLCGRAGPADSRALSLDRGRFLSPGTIATQAGTLNPNDAELFFFNSSGTRS